MVAEKIFSWEVADYKELWKLYKAGEIGNSLGQTLPDNLKKMKAGRDGTDEELIIALLSLDDDNMYHVEFINDGRDGYFKITIIGFQIVKHFDTPVKSYLFSYGEVGRWQEENNNEVVDNSGWDDSSSNGIVEVSADDRFTHDVKEPVHQILVIQLPIPSENAKNYGKRMTDQYGRTYVQTPQGKIYDTIKNTINSYNSKN